MTFGKFLRFVSVILLLSFPLTSFSYDPNEYDRLDGKGKSGVRVDVIEWEENLEVHVYPRGSIAGLAMKVDRAGTPAMVFGYRFVSDPEDQLIRRNILSINLKDGFIAYLDTKETEFDKIVISNSKLAGRYSKFNLDPEPKHLFPKEHPDRVAEEAQKKREEAAKAVKNSNNSSKKTVTEGGASQGAFSPEASAVTGAKQEVSREPVSLKEASKKVQEPAPEPAQESDQGDSNSIKSFAW